LEKLIAKFNGNAKKQLLKAILKMSSLIENLALLKGVAFL
jgi:hypothetical protein